MEVMMDEEEMEMVEAEIREWVEKPDGCDCANGCMDCLGFSWRDFI